MKPNRLDYPSQDWEGELSLLASRGSLAKCPELEAGQKATRPSGWKEAPIRKWLIYKAGRA